MKPKALTFDYFGTLVNVATGGIRGIEGVLQHLALTTTQTAANVYADWDRRTVQGYRSNAYRRYREVAQQALNDCLEALHEGCTRGQDMAALTELLLTHLVESSPPFDDAVVFLDWARDRFVLMPITNMDTDLWRRSRLVEYFPKVTTAEMARAYKPSETIFRTGLTTLGMRADEIFHCSIGTWADIDGAKPLGIKVAWINRGAEKLGDFQARPDYEFATLEPVRSVLEHLINE
ncbi:HAD family hydrolase [Paraburkholderia phymatum]|uniref:Haloacid dehalogenase domain protein hydrolase n=1 Tax=Paraburkholderia phymatum (strain DSM 17167 / CIP 108236 / LMG 21445 / STM815) TaxID=391038 RepID=B2JW89_PARP8|nr:Haloacid dehalogenase domain protein hydrolase [Paraburkholderia phymatum STM815]